MSDAQKLKDCITEYRKANAELDKRLRKAEQDNRQARQEQEAELSRQD